MNICKIDISNFRGIKKASILVSKNAVFVGDNNSGKSTLFEAVDLVMGPDRLSRSPVIDEHDFYAGEYLANNTPVQIKIEVGKLYWLSLKMNSQRYIKTFLKMQGI